MGNQEYQATLSRTGDRNAWCVIFRHPLLKGKNGTPGRRIRRGLGTQDQSYAQQLVDQLNELLRNKSLWVPVAREELLRIGRFDPRIVSAFYDNLVLASRNPWSVRDAKLPLPDGAKRVLLVGTTGAGKTTVVRQLIGTDPKIDRFPSTSTAKTTISDIEILMRDTVEYEAVVTFLSEEEVRQYIDECVTAAALIAFEGGVDAHTKDIARKLLEHTEQRFRLSYVLGTLPLAEDDEEEDESENDETDQDVDSDGVTAVSDAERQRMVERLEKYILEIRALAVLTEQAAKPVLNEGLAEASKRDQEAFEEIVEELIHEQETFHQLVDQVLDDVRSRFAMLHVGILERDHGDWPQCWSYTTTNRQDFIKQVNFFSSNYAPHFGRLLTPIVEGIRVAGPFRPEWESHNTPPLIIIDGEGLGHTPSSMSSLPPKLTDRFPTVDTIIMVDNAAMPMQAAPGAVLRELVVSGHASKLLIAMTHFDQVRGDNLRTVSAKRDHVLGSLDNMIETVCAEFGRGAAFSLRRDLSQRTFFLANIQRGTSELKDATLQEFQRLLNMIVPHETISPQSTEETEMVQVIAPNMTTIVPAKIVPIYDETLLMMYMQSGLQEFRDIWRGQLGLAYRPGTRRQHWTRIKALSRWIGYLGTREYSDLRPASDFASSVKVQTYKFLVNEVQWGSPELDDATVNRVAREISAGLERLARSQIIDNCIPSWQQAYSQYSGPGSTLLRARHIDTMYSQAAPVLSEVSNLKAIPVVDAIRQIFRHAIDVVSQDSKGASLTVTR